MNKFKVGQKIVCINNKKIITPSNYGQDHGEKYLKLHEIYTTASYIGTSPPRPENIVYININSKIDWFLEERFISIKEYRKLKLKKLNNE